MSQNIPQQQPHTQPQLESQDTETALSDTRAVQDVSEVDDLLDEIDDLLAENAEDFVSGFIQKGGQ